MGLINANQDEEPSRQDEKPTLADDVDLAPTPPCSDAHALLQSAVTTPSRRSDDKGMATGLINANPVIDEKKERRIVQHAPETIDKNAAEPIDRLEVFDHIRNIKDPEHPYSLEQLSLVSEDSIELNNELNHVRPTSEAAPSRQDEKPTLTDDVDLAPAPPCSDAHTLLQSRQSPLCFATATRVMSGTDMGLINANPIIHENKERRTVRQAPEAIDENAAEPIDRLEVFDHIRNIKDPEHSYSLEQLNVVTEDSIELNDELNHVRVTFTPTVPHCSMAYIIGLCIRAKLLRSLPRRYKVDIRVAPGSHATEADVNKKLNDKERVAAALENSDLMDIVEKCLSPTFEC